MITPEIMKVIRQVANKHGLSPSLVAAIVEQESAGEVYTQRIEPDFRYFFDPLTFSRRLRVSVETERMCQATSWGLMQIMGAVCRERGFMKYFGEIFQPEINLEYGCRHLKSFLDLYKTEVEAIASYNAGSPRKASDGKGFVNQHYVNTVLELKKKFDGH